MHGNYRYGMPPAGSNPLPSSTPAQPANTRYQQPAAAPRAGVVFMPTQQPYPGPSRGQPVQHLPAPAGPRLKSIPLPEEGRSGAIQHTALDVRGNDVAATQRESRWAVQLWSHLSPAQCNLFVTQLHQMIKSVRACEHQFNNITAGVGMDKAASASLFQGFRKAGELEWHLKKWAKNGENSVALANRVQSSIKQTIDLLGTAMKYYTPGLYKALRHQPVFTDRGRQSIPGELRRRDSYENRHAGIADTENRRPSTENFFRHNITHAKSSSIRQRGSQTAQRFQDSGTPFIAGASGTAQFIIHHMELPGPYSGATPQERQAREALLVMHAALMTLSGHHSVMESLIVGRNLGYFADLPDPLQGRDGYRNCMRALDGRLRSMGLDAGVKLRS